MLGPRSAIASCVERYPRTTTVLYQLLLCVISFECVLSIARYDHNPNGSPPLFLTPAEMNATHEHICKISAREADVPVGPLQSLIPYFMLCPSTLTLIGACIGFVACMVKWGSFYSDSPFDIMPFPLILIVVNIQWTRFLESIQMLLPMYIWTCYFMRALFDPFFQWALPVMYAGLVERKREARRLAEERWKKQKVGDVELGEPAQVDEQTPLAG